MVPPIQQTVSKHRNSNSIVVWWFSGLVIMWKLSYCSVIAKLLQCKNYAFARSPVIFRILKPFFLVYSLTLSKFRLVNSEDIFFVLTVVKKYYSSQNYLTYICFHYLIGTKLRITSNIKKRVAILKERDCNPLYQFIHWQSIYFIYFFSHKSKNLSYTT